MTVVREITHAAAQSVHEYVWRVKWDQGKRNGRLGRSNSHRPDRESWLTSQLPTRWRACKLLHCTIDPDVVFWYADLNPAWMHERQAFGKSLSDAGLQKDCCRKKGYFQRRNSAVHLLLRRNWFHVFSFERLFSFCYWGGIPYSPPLYYNDLGSFPANTNFSLLVGLFSEEKVVRTFCSPTQWDIL